MHLHFNNIKSLSVGFRTSPDNLFVDFATDCSYIEVTLAKKQVTVKFEKEVEPWH